MSKAPFPVNESARLASLLDLDLDYGDLKEDFKHIVLLVSKTTGMDMSVVNLIDTFTQWTVANHGLSVETVAREDSVCQYTILEDDHLEVLDLSQDENHKDKFYVKGDPHLRYYFGVPLKTSSGVNIGSLCVLDREPKKLSPEQIEFLKIVADEVVIKLKAHKTVSKLRDDLDETLKIQKKIAVELQDSLAGIIGISEILMDPEIPHTAEDAEGFIGIINERCTSMLNQAQELITKTDEDNESSGTNLEELCERLKSLYLPLAQNRNQVLDISVNSIKNHIQFSSAGIFSALNYPLSGAIYLSQRGSVISVNLDIDVLADSYILTAFVKSNSAPAPKAEQLSPPEQEDCEVKYLADAEGWHFEMRLPVKVS
jgi:hypothetical protein